MCFFSLHLYLYLLFLCLFSLTPNASSLWAQNRSRSALAVSAVYEPGEVGVPSRPVPSVRPSVCPCVWGQSLEDSSLTTKLSNVRAHGTRVDSNTTLKVDRNWVLQGSTVKMCGFMYIWIWFSNWVWDSVNIAMTLFVVLVFLLI